MLPHVPDSSVPDRRRRWVDVAAIALAAALVLLPNLGGPALWDEDEPLNAGCSLAMLQTGDWLVPTFNGRLRVEKPALVNWLQLAGFALVGPTEAGARLPSAVVTIGTCLITWSLGGRLFSPAVGFWAGLALATAVWTAVAGRAATPDAPLAFCTTLALAIFARGLPASRGAAPVSVGTRSVGTPPVNAVSIRTALATGAACGLAMLAKGPVGLVFPLAAFLVFGCWQALTETRGALRVPVRQLVIPRQLICVAANGWRRVRPLTIMLAALAVAAPWYATVTLRTEGAWLQGFLFVHNVGRFTAAMEGHTGSAWLYYPVVILIGMFPWSCGSALIGLHAVHTIRCRHAPDGGPDESRSRGMRLLAAWVAVWIGGFSLSATKLPGYVWPAYPALAVMTGLFVVHWIERQAAAPDRRADRWMRLAWLSLAGAGLAIAIGLPLATARLAPGVTALGLIGLSPLVGAAACWLWHDQGRRHAAGLSWACAGGIAVALLASVATATLGDRGGARALVTRAAAEGASGGVRKPLAGFVPPPSVAFYASRILGTPLPDLATSADIAAFATAHPDGRLIIDAQRLPDVAAGLPEDWVVLGEETTAVRLQRLVLMGRADVSLVRNEARH